VVSGGERSGSIHATSNNNKDKKVFRLTHKATKTQTFSSPNKNSQKIASTSSSHPFQLTIKELIIMQPFHGQNTAALQ
jgi:hypothetical protein